MGSIVEIRTVRLLIVELVETIVADALVDAILDDGVHASVKRRAGRSRANGD